MNKFIFKVAAFYDMTSYSRLYRYRRFERKYCRHFRIIFYFEDEGNMLLRNFGKDIPEYIASQPKITKISVPPEKCRI
jgi:hypothetical protein